MWISKKKLKEFEKRIADLEQSQSQHEIKATIDSDNISQLVSLGFQRALSTQAYVK